MGIHLTYRGAKIRITSNFSETMQARGKWTEIFKVLREKTTNLEFCALKNYPSEMMRECVACRPALEEKLKVL